MKKSCTSGLLSCVRILFLFCAIVQCVYAGGDAKSILSKVEKKYNGIRDAAVIFSQHVRFGVTEAEQTFRGTLLMKKGNKYHIEVEDQIIITDGTSVWSYAKNNKQVIIDRYKDDPGSFSPDKILVDVPEHYSPSILGSEKINGQETSILKLIPLDSKSNIQWMKIWVDHDDWLMRKIQVFDISENLTTYSIERMTLNEGVKESQFTFQTPAGVEVIDLR